MTSDYRFDLPQELRERFINLLNQFVKKTRLDLLSILDSVEREILVRYGRLSRSGYRAADVSDYLIINHFHICTNEEALEFIEICFEQEEFYGENYLIERTNEMFSQMKIGYEFPLFPPKNAFSGLNVLFGRKWRDYPKAFRKGSEPIHQNIVQPIFHLIKDPEFSVVSEEVSKAFENLNSGNFENSITLSDSAFESFLKTICSRNSWSFDADKDTCSALIKSCKDHDLFPGFYVPVFEAVGTIRNKLGDAHGRGPKKLYSVSKENAEHMFYLVLNHILLISKIAQIK